MEDVDERPAVPPRDEGADVRYGWYVAGGVLVAFGFGLLVLVNLALHATAPTNGTAFGPVRIFRTLGTYSIGTAILGAIGGAVGLVLLRYASLEPRGPFVLPGEPY